VQKNLATAPLVSGGFKKAKFGAIPQIWGKDWLVNGHYFFDLNYQIKSFKIRI